MSSHVGLTLTAQRKAALGRVLSEPQRRDVDRILSAHFWRTTDTHLARVAAGPDAERRHATSLFVLPLG